MKRFLLLAGVALAALAPAPAAAQFTDVPAIAQRTAHQIQTLAQWKIQVDNMVTRVRQAKNQLDSITGIRSVEGAGRVLMNEALRRPSAPSVQILDYLEGTVRAGNMERWERMRRYEPRPDDTDYDAEELRRRRTGLANVQAELFRGIEAAEERVVGLLELLGLVERQEDMRGGQALDTRIKAEGELLANEETKLRRFAALMQAQERSDTLRDREEGRRQADVYYERTLGVWDVPWDR